MDESQEKTYFIQAKRGFTFENKRVVIAPKILRYYNPSIL